MGQPWHIEFCSRGGSFGWAHVVADTHGDAIRMVNESELVDTANTNQTRAVVWWVRGIIYATREAAVAASDAADMAPICRGITR